MKQRVFVTGGAHGIGKSIVEGFAAKGDSVHFCDINIELGQEVAEKTGATFHYVDVTDVNTLERCMDAVFQEEGDIDILVNNVGIGVFKPITEITVEEFDKEIDTNLRSAFVTSRMLAIHRERNGNKKFGRIINLCSSRYLQSEPGTEGYSASKGGIYSLTHALAISLAPMKITVNAIAPGWIHVKEDEDIRPIDNEFHPSGRVGKPEDIARLCLFLSQPENDFINGQTITVDGGTTIKMIYPE